MSQIFRQSSLKYNCPIQIILSKRCILISWLWCCIHNTSFSSKS